MGSRLKTFEISRTACGQNARKSAAFTKVTACQGGMRSAQELRCVMRTRPVSARGHHFQWRCLLWRRESKRPASCALGMRPRDWVHCLTPVLSAFGRVSTLDICLGYRRRDMLVGSTVTSGRAPIRRHEKKKRASRDSLQRSQQALLSSGMNPNDRLFASNRYAFSSTKIAIVALCLPARLGDGAGHNDFRRRVRQRSLIR